MKAKIGVLIVVVLAALVAGLSKPEPAAAHGVTFPHQWVLEKIGIRTKATPTKPLVQCTRERDGEWAVIYDPILKAWIHWVCRCDGDVGCRWYRVHFYSTRPYMPGSRVTMRYTRDNHRTCESIVCIWHRHHHRWNTMHAGSTNLFDNEEAELQSFLAGEPLLDSIGEEP